MALPLQHSTLYKLNQENQRLANSPDQVQFSFIPVNPNTGVPEAGGRDYKSQVSQSVVPQFSANTYNSIGYVTGTMNYNPEISEFSSRGINNQKITTITRLDSVSLDVEVLENPYRLLRENRHQTFRIVTNPTRDLKNVEDVYVLGIGKFKEPDFDTSTEFQSYPVSVMGEINNSPITITAGDIAAGLNKFTVLQSDQSLYMSVYNDAGQKIKFPGNKTDLEVAAYKASEPPYNAATGSNWDTPVMTIEPGKYIGMMKVKFGVFDNTVPPSESRV